MRRSVVSFASHELFAKTAATTQTLQPKRHTSTMSEPTESNLEDPTAKAVDESKTEESGPADDAPVKEDVAAAPGAADGEAPGSEAAKTEDGAEKAPDGKEDAPMKEEGDAEGDEVAPTLVDAGDSKLMKELDDEAPKTFPQVLMDILSNEENSDTISWLPHGRSFIIYKKKKFAAHVLPKYFKATKFTSFTRKLNRWGFTRVTRGPEMGSYYHKLFLREDSSLCLRMSSHSSSKFQEQQQLVPSPMAPMPFGMPVAFGMPGMAPGMQPMMPGGMPGMNPADLSQQNQFINQQLQQLQWQQFQLQQLQQQQQHHAQQQGHSPHGPPMHPPHPGMGPPPGHPSGGHGPHGGPPPPGPPQQGGPPPMMSPPPGAPMPPHPVGGSPAPPPQSVPNGTPTKREGV